MGFEAGFGGGGGSVTATLPQDPVITPSAATVVLGARVQGDAADRITLGTDGLLRWGPGTAGADATLARSGIGRVQVGGQLESTADLVVQFGVATQLRAGNAGPSGQSGISFQQGEAGGAIYRAAAGLIKVDQTFQAGAYNGITNGPVLGTASANAGAVSTQVIISAGSGAPNNANGANGDIYIRQDGGAGTTIYQRRAGAWVGIV